MSMRKVTLIPGDLLGQDLAGPITELLAEAGGEIEWEWEEAGGNVARDGDEGPVPERVIESIRRNGLALQAPMATPEGGGHESPAVILRKALGLYAGVRIMHNVRGIPSRYENVDLVIIRENTEDVYAGLEHQVHPGVVESIKVVTRTASERIFRFGFRYAQNHNRKRVAIVHKANIMKLSDGLFLKVGLEIAEQFPDLETRSLIVDNACQQLVQRPEQFDMLICPNLYGDIISDLGAGLVGGIAAVAGINQGDDCVVFECVHGRARELLGQDIANPIPMLLPGFKLLRHVRQNTAADRLRRALENVLEEGRWLTADLGGSARTSEMIRAIKGALR